MKKMRRMIPAFAMLMVAAIMLSTASYAWFTMNEQVTASGMQVQAKAAGSLLISRKRMTASSKDISVDFTDITKKNLKPITYIEADTDWQAVLDAEVDPLYGTITKGSLDSVDVVAPGEYFYEQVVYIATAGNAYKAPLQMDIEAIAGMDAKIAPAYTIVISVGETANWAAPDLFYSYDAATEEGATYKATTKEFDIPSTYGATAATAVGLKVTIRIYVDGNMDGPIKSVDKHVLTQIDYSTFKFDANSMKDWTFYYKDDENAVAGKGTDFTADMDLAGLGITHYWDNEASETETHASKIVNNENIPVAGTVFSVNFKADIPENTNP